MFRYNITSFPSIVLNNCIYIPLCSDITIDMEFLSEYLIDLYPSMFRYNVKGANIARKQKRIYIPLCSDITRLFGFTNRQARKFISLYVQI